VEVGSSWDECSDEELLVAIGDGHRDALRALHDRHATWLELRVARRCADRQITEEVIQDLFVVIWRNPGAYRGTGEVGAWMWGIAIRRLMQRLRPRRPLLDRLVALRPPTGETPEEVVLGQVAHGDLADALNGLAPELRAVVQATILDGLTMKEAARMLAIPEGTVKTRMSRARTQLREALT
jgi:RNA polymerase sigma-70 factor (ECF subfamily)